MKKTAGKTRLNSVATKALIIQAAERLFAQKGIDNVSLVEISKTAKQKNRAAAQYHFTDKSTLLNAIMNKHLLVIDHERNSMIDHIESSDTISSRDIAASIVLPLANRLSDDNGGFYYIQIMSQLLGSEHFPHLQREDLESHFASRRLYTLAKQVSQHLPEVITLTRTRFILSLLFHSLADFAGDISEGGAVPRDIFIADLVDCVDWLLIQTPSAHTQSLVTG